MRLSAPVHLLKQRAKLLARSENIPLHAALDRIARQEGFAAWSLLSSRLAAKPPRWPLLPRLTEGDLLLLGARPGHGKTLLGLRLLLEAARHGRRAVFFTLEYTERETRDRIRSLDGGKDMRDDAPEVVASDEICAASIALHLSGSPRGTVAVIDYLQILDQRRSKPALSQQMGSLRDLAREQGLILGFISQIDRSFDPRLAPLPTIGDVRLPNPVETGVFSKACFLHDGAVRFEDMR